MPDIAVDLMQSATLERNKFSALHIRTDSAAPAIESNSDLRLKHGSIRLLDNSDIVVAIHSDEALVRT